MNPTTGRPSPRDVRTSLFPLCLAVLLTSAGSTRSDGDLPELGPAPAAEFRFPCPTDDGCGIVVAQRDDPPRFMLNTGGATGVVRSLAVNAAGTRTFSAGFDKTVQVWELGAGARGLARGRKAPALLTQTLHWEVARGLRGTINVIAANPVGPQLAIGGYSARDATGDIVVYNTETLRVERALRGHRDAIVSLDFSPPGDALVSVSRDGEIRLSTAAGNWTTKVLRKAGGPATSYQPIRFLNATTLVYASPADAAGTNWRANVYSVNTSAVRTVDQVHGGRVRAIAVQPGRMEKPQWASSDQQGNVFLWDGVDALRPRLLRTGREAISLAFTKSGRLIVGTNLSKTAAGGSSSYLELWDARSGQLIDETPLGTQAPCFACTVDPGENRIVAVAGDGSELRSFSLSDADGRSIAKPLSGGVAAALKGRGAAVQSVAFAESPDPAKSGYVVGFGAERFAINRAFSFDDGRLRPAAGLTFRRTSDRLGAWRLRVDPAQQADENATTVWHVYKGNEERGTITADPKVHGKFSCWCWLANQTGEPYAIAFGSRITDGIFVYGLANGGEWPLKRYYRDHNGAVASLAVSPDGRYLASGSFDQTVKVWNLEGLRDPQGEFRQAAAWGAELRANNGRMEVISSNPAGIAYQRGLFGGDRILRASVPQNGRVVELTDPAAMFDAFVRLAPNDPVLLRVERQGRALETEILLVPAWLPVATLFVDNGGDWAWWTPTGFFDASVDGDTLFGWLINRGVDATPAFYRAEHLRRDFERPALMRRLLEAGNIRDALKLTQMSEVGVESKLVSTLSDAPRVEIVEPKEGAEIAGGQVRVLARLVGDERLLPAFSVRTYVNGVPGKEVRVQGAGDERTLEWSAAAVDAFSRVRVQVEAANPDRPVHSADVHVRSQPRAGGRTPRLNLFTLAVRDYKFVDKLPSTLADADSIAAVLSQHSGKLYNADRTVSLRDAQVSRESLRKAMIEWKSLLAEAQPDDLLVVFLAGHGIALSDAGEYYFVPIDAKPETVEKDGIPWSDFAGLRDLPCRKLFLLDTCHSGSVLAASRGDAANWKRPVRTLKQGDMLVLSATDVGQEALESTSLGHGLFTQCLLEGLSGAAPSGGDGVVLLQGLADYVEREVPRRTAAVGRVQTPRRSPPELFDLLAVPLAEKKP